MWYFIRVNKQEDIGKNEEERVLITDIKSLAVETAEDLGKFGCTIKGTYVHPATPSEETDSAPRGENMEDKDIIGKLYATIRKVEKNMESQIEMVQNNIYNETKDKKEMYLSIQGKFNTIWDKEKQQATELKSLEERVNSIETQIEDDKNYRHTMNLELIKKFDRMQNEIESRTEQLSDDPKVMTIEEAGRILTGAELKESYKKGWLYKKGELPQEPDIVEQIKAGEKSLLKNKSPTEEYNSLREHIMKLVSVYTKLPIGGIEFDKDKVTYVVYRKGFKIEFQ